METTKIGVIIADSDAEHVELLAEYLSNENFEVIGKYTDGKAVIEGIMHSAADVVLLGSVLQGIDGIGVLNAVKSMSNKPSILLYSSINSSSFIRRASELGADYYILKPCDLSAIAERVRIFADKDVPAPALPNGTLLEERVTEMMHKVGVPAHIRGYNYMRKAIMMAVEDSTILNYVTKDIYPAIAKQYGTTLSRVERAIRHSITVAWQRTDEKNIKEIFGYSFGGDRPTNSEFIAIIADKLNLELKKL